MNNHGLDYNNFQLNGVDYYRTPKGYFRTRRFIIGEGYTKPKPIDILDYDLAWSKLLSLFGVE